MEKRKKKRKNVEREGINEGDVNTKNSSLLFFFTTRDETAKSCRKNPDLSGKFILLKIVIENRKNVTVKGPHC